ncbi:lytic transglycosylase domain-containing protein [Rhodoblastus sp.]|uniref:lytic transglycosylase domain-containing protein n=1 Tax=Rhodoblastus sp. TaxID=1962975 RepID=UPI003F9A6184
MNESGIRDLVRAEAAKQGVDEKLALAIALQESRFGVELNSPKGARGPMQLMPATAAMYGVTDICNPVQNVRGGVSYLKHLGAAFQGNMMLVAAAYNAGPERVYQAQGVPAISETVRYVASVTNSYYGLKPLSTRKGKHSAPVAGPAETPATPTAEVAQHEQPTGKQDWIGGSVLYVIASEGEEKQ